MNNASIIKDSCLLVCNVTYCNTTVGTSDLTMWPFLSVRC